MWALALYSDSICARGSAITNESRDLLVLKQFKVVGHITYPNYQPILATLHQLQCHFHWTDSCLFF